MAVRLSELRSGCPEQVMADTSELEAAAAELAIDLGSAGAAAEAAVDASSTSAVDMGVNCKGEQKSPDPRARVTEVL